MFARRLILLAACACLPAMPVAGHHVDKVEPARRMALPSDRPIEVGGRVTELLIRNQVAGSTSRVQILTGTDGKRYLIVSPALALDAGAAYAVSGRTDGKVLFVEQASRVEPPVAVGGAAQKRGAVTVEGHLRLGHADNFDGGPSEFFFAIVGDATQYRLNLAVLIDGLENGMPAVVTGEVDAGGEMFADEIVILGPGFNRADLAARPQGTTGYLVMPVKFPTNASAPFTYNADPFTVASLASSVFGVAPVKSVAEYYKEVSYGQQLLSGIVADDGSGGWLLANVATPASCDINAIATAAENAATARGYNLASYAGRVYVFTSNVPGCGWSGLAYVNWARSWIKQTSSLLVIGHELGHNFGLLHAASLDCGANVIGGTCTSSEYGDPFNTMGNQRAMHFAAAQKSLLGWIPSTTVATHKSGNGTYALTPIETPGGAKYAIKVPAGPNRTYWIEYRQPLGFDSGLSSYPNNGAQIRVASPFESICSGCADDTEFLDLTPATSAFTDGALVVGQSYVDSTYGITVNAIAQGGGQLTVSIASPTRPSFVDVPATHPNYADIETVYWYGITKGCATNPLAFCPTGTVSRAEMAAFIERAKRGGSFTGTASGSPFTDVPAGYWAGGWIEQLYADGITAGCATGPLRFCPDNRVSRAEMAIFLMRARYGSAYNPGTAAGTVFSDVAKTYWAAAWIERAYQYTVMPACASSPLRFCPDALVTRAEMATLLRMANSLKSPL